MPERFYLGDTHLHSTFSDGRLSPAELALVGAARHLDFVAVTDHTGWRGKGRRPSGDAEGWRTPRRMGEGPGLCLLAGQELSAGERLHLLLLGFSQPLPRPRLERLDQVAEAVHAAGGVVILAHPWTTFAKSPERVRVLDRAFAEGHLDGLEVFSGGLGPTQFGLWRRMFSHYARQWAPYGPATLASSDWHHRAHGRAVGLACTYVLAPALTPEALLAGIAARRTLAVLQPVTALEDGYCHEGWVGPEEALPAGVAWRGQVVGPPDLVDALFALEGEVARRLAGRMEAEVRGAALAAHAGGNYRRALALLDLGRE